jgi:hypothetical protein
MRTFLAGFHLTNFLVLTLVTVYFLFSPRSLLEAWRLPLFGYYIVSGIGGVTLALWVALDGKRIQGYASKIKTLEEKLTALEKKIRIIKPDND